MIKLALIDVGETLIHNNEPLPHVHDALRTVTGFDAANGEPLALSIVSDYFMPEPPATEQKIAAIERAFVELLHNAGLDAFFDPPEMRITLSTRAGVNKPDRRIFELAVQRSGTGAALSECLFVTENRQHLAKCREYGMTALRFGNGSEDGHAFSDWSEGPLLIARLVAPASDENLQAALAVRLAATHGFELSQCEPARGSDAVRGRGKAWVRLENPRLRELSNVHVQLPIDVSVRLDSRGHLVAVESGAPDPDDLAEATAHVESLMLNKQIATGTGRTDQATTHRVEVDEHGQRFLKRQRFTMR